MNPIAGKENHEGRGMEEKFLTLEEKKARIEAIKNRASELGVVGMSLYGSDGGVVYQSDADLYNFVLDVVEKDKEMLDEYAGRGMTDAAT